MHKAGRSPLVGVILATVCWGSSALSQVDQPIEQEASVAEKSVREELELRAAESSIKEGGLDDYISQCKRWQKSPAKRVARDATNHLKNLESLKGEFHRYVIGKNSATAKLVDFRWVDEKCFLRLKLANGRLATISTKGLTLFHETHNDADQTFKVKFLPRIRKFLLEAEANQENELERQKERMPFEENADTDSLQGVAQTEKTSIEDVIDNPDQHVGRSYTFTVWMNGLGIRPLKHKNDDGKVVVDGYAAALKAGHRDPARSDSIGNPFILAEDELNPFISSKDLARSIKESLDPLEETKVVVTFVVRAVVLNEWKELNTRDVGFIADITSIKLSHDDQSTHTLKKLTQDEARGILQFLATVSAARPGWGTDKDLLKVSKPLAEALLAERHRRGPRGFANPTEVAAFLKKKFYKSFVTGKQTSIGK